jgi:hypothetical protein
MVLAPPFSTKRWKKEDEIECTEKGLLVSLRASQPQRPTRGKKAIKIYIIKQKIVSCHINRKHHAGVFFAFSVAIRAI